MSDREQRRASAQQIRHGPLDKEWDWEHTITSGEYNLPASPLSPSFSHYPLSALPSRFLLCGVCLLLVSLAVTSPFFTAFLSSCLHTLFLPTSPLRSLVHLQVFCFENAEVGNNGTGELKAHFSFWLCYIFPFTSYSSVFLIDWPGGLTDPERDEGAELHKKLGLWTRHALLLAYTNSDTHTCRPCVLTYTYTHVSQWYTQTHQRLSVWRGICV